MDSVLVVVSFNAVAGSELGEKSAVTAGKFGLGVVDWRGMV